MILCMLRLICLVRVRNVVVLVVRMVYSLYNALIVMARDTCSVRHVLRLVRRRLLCYVNVVKVTEWLLRSCVCFVLVTVVRVLFVTLVLWRWLVR